MHRPVRGAVAILLTLLVAASSGCRGSNVDEGPPGTVPMRLVFITERPGFGRVEQQGAIGHVDLAADRGTARLRLPDGGAAMGIDEDDFPPIHWTARTATVGGERLTRAGLAATGGWLGRIPDAVRDLANVAGSHTGSFPVSPATARTLIFASYARSPVGWTAIVERDSTGRLKRVTVRFPIWKLGDLKPAGSGQMELRIG